ncbi:DEAD/DEAH box helicase [Arcobacter sp. FWKO B]|uniref:DEAD/DEAH box helicase n=1 Tax=Arcobacter sp. FWKO B TaxID=2593672 RepID=UPI0018A3B664|nr:DEAD/DEAH box helicase [Arcobacter sp. FWKO B]QOG11917.1 DEAD/DEAH box helicase [Arcobacter sp. FWKO B]
MSFSSFNLCSQLQQTLANIGFSTPTPIQTKVIPLVLEKNDILARAKTGSGKSASFILPILELYSRKSYEGKSKVRALVLTPTRDLTIQVAKAFEMFGGELTKKPKVVSIIGGEGISEQLYAIQRGCDILVATSGRLVDILDKGQLNLAHIEFFVLDEADKMLNLGFSEELDSILLQLPPKRQNLLFSATYPQKILDIALKITTNALEVTIDEDVPTVDTVTQEAISVNSENRGPLLRHLLSNNPSWGQVLVFMANKRATDNIAAKFRKYGFSAESFHGDLTQEDRNFTLDEFKAKKIKILFATDIAARGLDIDGIDCVVNYDLPRSSSDYIHRIGRTARAGKSGFALSFVTLEDTEHFKTIKKQCKLDIEPKQIEGFELVGTPLAKEKGKAPVKGKRKSKKDKLRESALK